MLLTIILVLIGVAIVALGWHFGWFRFSTNREDPKPNLTVAVDKGKIKADKTKVLDKIKPAPSTDHD